MITFFLVRGQLCFYKRRKNYSIETHEEDLELELLIVVGVVEQIMYNLEILPLEPPTYVLLRFYNFVGVPWDKSFPQTIPITPIERGNKKKHPSK